MRHVLALVLTYFGIITVANAATITKHEANNYGCTISLNGMLAAGDSKAIEPLLYETYEISLSDDGRYGETLCLNSPGGDLNEGIKIANYVYEYYTSTEVPSNARCESACAVIFLASRDPRIDPAGTVGLHAPKLTLPKGDFTEKDVEKAYDLSVYTIREIMKLPTFPPAGVRYMMSTPFSEMYIPQTFFELSELGVALSTSPKLPPISVQDMMENVCRWSVWKASGGNYFANPMVRRMEFVGFTRADKNSKSMMIEGEFSVHDAEESYFPCKVVIQHSLESPAETLERLRAMGGMIGNVKRFSVTADTLGDKYYALDGELLSPDASYLAAHRTPHSSGEHFFQLVKSINEEVLKDQNKDSKPRKCFIDSTQAVITNVQNFTNLRRQAGLNGQVIGQVPLGATVSVVKPGQFLRYDRCAATCNGTNQNAIKQCIDNNDVWIEVDYNGRRGFLSRKFLE